VISLKKTIEAYDYRSMWLAALESYASAIQSLEKHAVAFDQEGLHSYRANLQVLKAKLETVDLNPVVLRDVASDLDSEIKHYRIEVEALIRDSATDLKDVVAVLAEATESLSQRENLHGNRLSRISGGLEAISQLDDLAQVRLTLNRQVSELRTCISNMAQDNENAIAGLQKEITLFQQKLEKVQVEAATDPLTGAANRRRCTREISSRIRSRQQFGVLLFDLNKFKGINDTLGHAAGDAVLKCVAQRLSSHISSDDLVCRWGGDEFVIVHSGSAQELAAVGRQFTEKISGTFSIRLDGINHDVTVGAEFGWADYRDGETPEQLLARADTILYETKTPQLKVEAAPPVSFAADPATGLPRIEALEAQLGNLQGDSANWFLGCFAIRSAARVNNHYGFPATDMVLPFLRDELIKSKFGECLFRGRGSSLLALVSSPGGLEGLETDLRKICNTGLEKFIEQKRRASVLPIAVGGKLFAAPNLDTLQQTNAFVDFQRADDQSPVVAGPGRGLERAFSPPKP
jgi:diguanylate cyclase (GGDEF)-like protein